MSTCERVFWSKDGIVLLIRARNEAKEPLRRYLVSQANPRLVAAATKYFGNWSTALRAAGVDPQSIIPLRTWNSDSVIAAISLHRRRGLPLNSHAVQAHRQGLYMAACRRFGSWAKALRASGIDPITVSRQRSDWTKASIIETIVQYKNAGKALNAGGIKPSSLSQAAYRLFGSWDAALVASGLDPSQIRRRQIWTPARVVAEIRLRAKERKELHAAAVAREWGSLFVTGISKFGSWSAALKAAGIIPEFVRRALPIWTRSKIIEHIRKLRDERKPLLPGRIKPQSIRAAANRLFGSWKGALRAAGMCVDHVYRHRIPWTRGRIIKTIRNGMSERLYLRDWGVPLSSLRLAATRTFGSWHAAIRAAGYDPLVAIKRGPRPCPDISIGIPSPFTPQAQPV